MQRDATAAAGSLGLQLVTVEANSERDFEPAFATLVARHVGALSVAAEPLFTSNRDMLVALAERYKIPTIYQSRAFPLSGGLMCYGASFVEAFRLGGRYVGQILKGAERADLPVQQSSRFELVINLKTAKALGLSVPPSLLIAADQVIE